MRLILGCLILAAVQWLGGTPAEAGKKLALLVGSSNYKSEDNKLKPLAGPKNDVRLMWQTLQGMGFAKDDITVLADSLERGADWPVEKALPTKQNILEEIRRLRTATAKEDFVVIHLAGHGAQLREARDEPVEDDGLDEIYLPIDFRVENGAPVNHIIDDEFEVEFYGANRFEANLWVLFDTCHSGTMTRGQMATRFGDLAEMKIDPKWLQPRETAKSMATRGTPAPLRNKTSALGLGGQRERVVAFSAVGPYELAIERPLGQRGEMHGVFTFLLSRILAEGGAPTYRELGEKLEAAYGSLDPGLPRPRFEGDLKSAVGSRYAPWEAKVAASDIELLVGNAVGLRKGSIVSLHETIEGPVLGYARVTEDGFLKSRAQTEMYREIPPMNLSAWQGRSLKVKPVEVVSYSLRVAAPAVSPRDNEVWVRTLRAALRTVEQRNAGTDGLPLSVVEAGQDADVHLWLPELPDQREAALILPPTGPVTGAANRPVPSIAVSRSADETANRLEAELTKLLRQRNLLDIAARLPKPSFQAGLEIKVYVDRTDRRAEDQACPEKKVFDATKAKLIERTDAMGLTHCDHVYLAFRNNGPRAIEVTCRYLDADGGIGWEPYQGERACAQRQRIEPNYETPPSAPLTIVTKCNETQPACKAAGTTAHMSVGVERLMIIALERDKVDPNITFEELDQKPVPRSSATRSAGMRGRAPADAFKALLMGARDGGTRGGADLGAPDVLMKTYAFTVAAPK